MYIYLVKNIMFFEVVVKSLGFFMGSMKGGVNCCIISEFKINVLIVGIKCLGLVFLSCVFVKDGFSKLLINCLNDL